MVADTRGDRSVAPSVCIEHALGIPPSDGGDALPTTAGSTVLGCALVEVVGVGAAIEVAPFLSVLATGSVVTPSVGTLGNNRACGSCGNAIPVGGECRNGIEDAELSAGGGESIDIGADGRCGEPIGAADGRSSAVSPEQFAC